LDCALIHTNDLATGKVAGNSDTDTSNDGSAYKTIGWFSSKQWCFSGNLQFLSNRDGRLLYIAPVRPGATHDVTADKKHIFDTVWPTGYGLSLTKATRM
jgi:hypothetical protein